MLEQPVAILLLEDQEALLAIHLQIEAMQDQDQLLHQEVDRVAQEVIVEDLREEDHQVHIAVVQVALQEEVLAQELTADLLDQAEDHIVEDLLDQAEADQAQVVRAARDQADRQDLHLEGLQDQVDHLDLAEEEDKYINT